MSKAGKVDRPFLKRFPGIFNLLLRYEWIDRDTQPSHQSRRRQGRVAPDLLRGLGTEGRLGKLNYAVAGRGLRASRLTIKWIMAT